MLSLLPALVVASKHDGLARFSLDWYVFGSALLGQQLARDLDVLVVYNEEAAVAAVKHAVSEACVFGPLDLVLMHVDEEEEFDFVSSVNAVRLADLGDGLGDEV